MRALSLASTALAAALVVLPGCGNADTYADLSTNSGVSSASACRNSGWMRSAAVRTVSRARSRRAALRRLRRGRWMGGNMGSEV